MNEALIKLYRAIKEVDDNINTELCKEGCLNCPLHIALYHHPIRISLCTALQDVMWLLEEDEGVIK